MRCRHWPVGDPATGRGSISCFVFERLGIASPKRMRACCEQTLAFAGSLSHCMSVWGRVWFRFGISVGGSSPSWLNALNVPHLQGHDRMLQAKTDAGGGRSNSSKCRCRTVMRQSGTRNLLALAGFRASHRMMCFKQAEFMSSIARSNFQYGRWAISTMACKW